MGKIGWLISGVLVAIVAVAVAIVFLRAPSYEDPTQATMAEGFMDRYAVELPVTTVLDAKPTGIGNAADDYLAAAKLYDQKRSIIFSGSNSGDGGMSPQGVRAAEQILATVKLGAAKSSAKLVNQVEGAKIDGHDPYEIPKVLEDLQHTARTCLKLGKHYIATGQHDKADEALQAGFTVGWHMNQQRGRYWIFAAGVRIQFDAIRLMIQNEKAKSQEASTETLTQYMRQLHGVSTSAERKIRLIQTHQPHAGDMFHIIEKDQDRMWKIEALLSLGMIKLINTGHEGNLIKAQQLLDDYANSKDPLVAAAASQAKLFSEEDAKQMGVIFED